MKQLAFPAVISSWCSGNIVAKNEKIKKVISEQDEKCVGKVGVTVSEGFYQPFYLLCTCLFCLVCLFQIKGSVHHKLSVWI